MNLKYILNYILAYFRLNQRAICTMSKDMGLYDFHDYSDEDEMTAAWHGYHYRCTHCGKEFMI